MPGGLPLEQVRAAGARSRARARARNSTAPTLAELAALDDAAFRALFAGSPIKRIGRDRFMRNVLIAIGNSGDPGLAPAARGALADASALVRAMAVWALGRLDPKDFAAAKARHLKDEGDADVRREWA